MIFKELDELIPLPLELNKLIYEYSSFQCSNCKLTQVECNKCHLYYCNCCDNYFSCLICKKILCYEHIYHQKSFDIYDELCDVCWNYDNFYYNYHDIHPDDF